MGRNEILIEFWKSEEVNNAFSKMHPIELQDDLKAEVFLILCEMPEAKLIDLYDKKQLRFYLVRIMLNLIQSTDKKFYQKYRNFTELVGYEKKDEEYNEDIINVNEHIENLYWYKQEIFRLYTFEFNKNARELSKNTGIHYMSIIRTLNQIKQELRKKIRQ
jgi:hypothetical protein